MKFITHVTAAKNKGTVIKRIYVYSVDAFNLEKNLKSPVSLKYYINYTYGNEKK